MQAARGEFACLGLSRHGIAETFGAEIEARPQAIVVAGLVEETLQDRQAGSGDSRSHSRPDYVVRR